MTRNRGANPSDSSTCEAGFEPCDIHDCSNCGARLGARDAGWIPCWDCNLAYLEAESRDHEDAA